MSTALDLLSDACVGLPHRAQKMFGGYGFFAPNGGMFAGILSDTEVMLKLVEGPARTELIALGGHPWTYTGQAKPMTMAQWIVVPEAFFDDPELFATWAKRAHTLVPPKKAKRTKGLDTRHTSMKAVKASAKGVVKQASMKAVNARAKGIVKQASTKAVNARAKGVVKQASTKAVSAGAKGVVKQASTKAVSAGAKPTKAVSAGARKRTKGVEAKAAPATR